MRSFRSSLGLALCALAIALLGGSPVAGAVWVGMASDGSAVVEELAVSESPAVTVRGYDDSGIDVAIAIPGIAFSAEKTKGGEFVNVDWTEAPLTGEVGTPGLPVVRRLFVVPNGMTATLEVFTGESLVIDADVTGIALPVKPVQPPIPKLPGARENAVFVMDAASYAAGANMLPERAVIQDLGIVRGQHLMLLEVRPVDYTPAANVLTFWPDLQVEINFEGEAAPASALSAMPGLNRIVLNPQQAQGGTRGDGNYLIITGTNFETDIAGFAAAKAAQGFTVTTHAVSPGTSSSTIKSYIQGLWGTADAPEYVLLVGDTETIPAWTGSGTGSPDTDIQYGCMDGSSDWYPDIAIGRFPVDNATELQTIVDKTLYYENGPLADPTYKKRAVFMASVDNYSISEGTHNYVINTHLDPNGFVSDKLYQVTYGADTDDVINSFNDGRFFGVYSGHGGTYSWGDGPPLSQTQVRDLTNANMYAFICSFACITGTYTVDECFMETWVLTDNGAVTACGSSVNSWWDEDDILEKRLFDAIFDNADAVKTEAGPVYNEAKLRFLAHFGADSDTRRYFEMYNLMGDPALGLPAACSDAGELQVGQSSYACEDTVEIELTDCGLNLDDGVVDTVDVTISSDSEAAGEVVTLTETDGASAQFQGSIAVSVTDSAGVLLIAENDTITVTYIDADDGQGGTNVVVTATAGVDCTPPDISNVRTTVVEPRDATVALDANEPVRGTVNYGYTCANLAWSASGSGYSLFPTVNLSGLQDDRTYYYAVEAEDQAGNSVSDDAGGSCYSFTTPEVPDFFTELFDDTEFDLANMSVEFAPNGSTDFYDACMEEDVFSLPTDPAGGTTVTWTSGTDDDGYSTITLSGGATVSIYGTAYSTFYIGTNGYITFVHGETGTTESLSVHLSGIPRISGLFDDLDPGEGGSVTWKQLGDRAVVTWENVPEYNTSNSNTFQIEMYFDGTIRLSYLAIAVEDGLVGLSEGVGIDPDFIESDLSELGPCAPPGDCDDDGDTDEDDFAVLWDCFSGTDGGVGTGCGCVNLDRDNDVDCKDWNEFRNLWTYGDPPTFPPCVRPTAAAAGSRFLAVTLTEGLDPAAILITGDSADPAVACLSVYVQTDGTLGPDPVFQLPSEWGTISVTGPQIGPNTQYAVQGDYGTVGSPMLSQEEEVTTWLWADTDHNLVVSIADVQSLVLEFQSPGGIPIEAADQANCIPDGVINMTDIQWAVSSFQGSTFWGGQCAAPCP